MHTQVTQQPCNGPGRIPAISMIVPGVTAILLTWGSSSIGGTSDIPAPAALLSAVLTPAYSTNEVLTDAAPVSVVVNAGICTAVAPHRSAEASPDSAASTWCTGAGSEELTEVATFLEWHVQARHLAQSAYQATLSARPRPHALDDRLTALSVAAALWVAFAR